MILLVGRVILRPRRTMDSRYVELRQSWASPHEPGRRRELERQAPAPVGEPIRLEDILPRLRCPASHAGLSLGQAELIASTDGPRYPFVSGVPDLRCAPQRLALDLPWYDPWDDLDRLDLSRPPPHGASDLPHHLDDHLASVPGDQGAGRWILEVGCGERQCEAYFSRRGFRYVGTDFDHRGIGPHLLSDAHNLPFESESFDLYTSMAVYEHLVSPLQAALEAFRILRDGGTFFGTAAFVYGFHDRASFHHMTHAGLLWTLRMAGFEVERIWSDWDYTDSIPTMAFGPGPGKPWQLVARGVLKLLDASFVATSNLTRRAVGKSTIDRAARAVERAGSLSFVAHKPGREAA